MNAKKTHWLRTTLIVLIICGIAGLALTSVRFFRNPDPTSASATLEFTFDGAAEGLAPNGAAFDLSGMSSDEVLTDALKASALDGTYTAQQIRESLVVRGVYPSDIAEQATSYDSLLNFTVNRQTTVGDYHPTAFTIVLSSDFDRSISQANLQGLLQNIITTYKDWFARVYANGLDAGQTLFDLDQYDYPQQLEIIQGRFEAISTYAQEMYERQSSFRFNGIGFNDISVRLGNLIASDISRLNADLTMNALTRDTSRLLTQYQFEIRDLSNQLTKQNERLEKMDALIASYDKNEIIYLSTSDSLTKIDGNSSETYDALVSKRKEVADNITQINSQIATYQLKLSDLMKDTQKDEPKQAATETPATAPSQDADKQGAQAQDGEPEAETVVTATDDVISAEDIVSMTEDEIAAAAEEAERQARAQSLALERNIATLSQRGDAIIDEFSQMLEAYNAQQINDLTVTASSVRYSAPKLLSGAFIKKAIKTACPICAIGFMLCMILIIHSRRREQQQG